MAYTERMFILIAVRRVHCEHFVKEFDCAKADNAILQLSSAERPSERAKPLLTDTVNIRVYGN